MVIDTLQLDIIVNNKGTTQRINNTTKSLQNLYNVIEQINGAGGVNGAVNGGGGSSRSGGVRSSNSTRNLNKALNIGSIVGKLYFIKNVTKQLGQSMAKVLQYGIDYEETLNLWQVAMRGNISQARTFVNEMNKAYGVSEATLMNYQAIFRNMLSALGNISEASSYAISESLTQMALDFASLYNVSVESAMTKFQAVLSGQVRPIRTAGYDITEQTLFQLYQQLGGTKTVRQLNQTEKQLLRILAVFKQMETVGATGDLRKTIESSANQLRIMKEQAKDFATWVGISLNLLLQESGILVTINSYLIALKELAKSVAYDLGYVEKDFGIEWGDNIAEAGKEVDKLKGKLLGFDKFQVLSSAGTEDVGIEQTLLDALGAYDSILDGFENPAFAKAEELLKAMGLHLEDIVDEEGNVIGQVWKVAEGEETVLDKLKDIGRAVGGLAIGILALVNPWLLIGAAIEYAYFTNEEFKTSVNGLLDEMKSVGQPTADILFSLFTEIVELVQPFVIFVLEILNEVLPLVQDIIEPIVSALEPIGKILGDVMHFVKVVVMLLTPIIAIVADLLGILTPILEIVHGITWVLSTVLTGSLVVIFDLLTPILFVFEAILKIVESIGEVVRALFQWDWGSLGKNLGGIWSNWRIGELVNNKPTTYSPSWKADGGLATKGSLFYAGEAGPELVTQTSGGNSTIMNMRQLEDAVARGFIRGLASTDNYEDNDTTEVYVDGQRLFNIMRGTAKRNGYDFVRV